MSLIWMMAGLIAGALLWLELRPLPVSSRVQENISREERSRSNGRKRLSVSVIIPARNEEQNIGKLLKSLKAQKVPPDEIIVVDDDSTDRTAEIARDRGAAVISPGKLPEGWAGKCHACWRGAAAAKGDLFIFIDADTYVKKNGLETLVESYDTGMMAVQPYHDTWCLYERLSAVFNIIVAVSAGSGKNGAGAYGPCIVTSKAAYEEVGGHEKVRGEVLDHHALGLQYVNKGYPVANYLGKEAVHFRMYPGGIVELFEGWIKSMASGAAATRYSKLVTVVMFLIGACTAFTSWDLGLLSVICYGMYAGMMAVLLSKVGKFGAMTAILYPIPLLTFLCVFIVSLVKTFVSKQVRWKGRELALDPKKQKH
ncbi:glycosyltransferase [Neobacillus mesonae]|nr:glycosyltransferase [Neobacillus mesonae]